MATNAERITALERRATAAEKRLTVAEAALADVKKRLTVAEGALVAVASRVTATEVAVTDLREWEAALAARVHALEVEDEPPPPPPTVLSGAAGDGAADGGFAAWRGTPLGVGGTWNDSLEGQTALWTIQPGAEWGAWEGALDVAIGAIYRDRGETWAAAAGGAYDTRWTSCVERVKAARGTAPTFLRFAHEFNGEWVPWKVTGGEAAAFVQAWRRFAGIIDAHFPDATLVFCPNDGTSSSLSLDWRTCFPGSGYVDVMGVDSYNQYPWVNTAADFQSKINRVDSYGAPIGIEKHRAFAESKGLPFAVCEWSSNADMGDAPEFMRQFRAWLDAHAGTGPGQVVYEVLFNVADFGTGQFALWPTTRQRAAADEYRARWGA